MHQRRLNIPYFSWIAAAALAYTLAACGSPTPPTPTVIGTPATQAPLPSDSTLRPTPTSLPQPVEVTAHLGIEPNSLDPALIGALDAAGNDLAANLFIGLTWLNPETGEIEPALAKSWERSTDGLTWTVYLRDDVYWGRINGQTRQPERFRPVTAADVVFTVRRACLSQTGALYAATLFIIEGCKEAYSVDANRQDMTTLTEAIGVRVLNDVAVEFKLVADSAAFPTILSTPILYPLPQEVVEAAGAGWTNLFSIATSGPFMLDPASPIGEGYTLIANPFWPLERTGNIDTVHIRVGPDFESAFADWDNELLDAAPIAPSALGAIPFGDAPGYMLIGKPYTTMLIASYDTPPMNNADVRRALALAIDRQALINSVLEPAEGTALPAGGMLPPGTAAAGPYDPDSVLYEPESARAALAAAGYSGCVGFPQTTLLVDDTDVSRALAERLIEMWSATLGCDSVFVIDQQPLLRVEELVTTPPDEIQVQFRGHRPGLTLLYWEGEYPDPHHWLADILGCREMFPEAYVNSTRPCVEADRWLTEAAAQYDPSARAAQYAQIQEAFFGPQGEMPAIPLYFETRAMAFQPWIQAFPLQAGPLRFDQWVVDEAQHP